jgi:hypothetical protein
LGVRRAAAVKVGYQEASHGNEQPGEQRTSYVMTGGTGSYLYMAPEVRRNERYNEKVRQCFISCATGC